MRKVKRKIKGKIYIIVYIVYADYKEMKEKYK